MPVVRHLIALTLLSALSWIAYLTARRLVPGCRHVALRWAAGALCAYTLLIALFFLLGAVSLFRVEVALPLITLMAAWAQRAWGGRLPSPETSGESSDSSLPDSALPTALDQLRADLVQAARVGRAGLATPGLRWVLLAGAAMILVRTLRGLVAPPLAWDALTYHLSRAGQWVQAGGLTTFPAPDAWGYYEHFPLHGDVIWAWALLPVRGDSLLAPVGLLIWLSCLLGGYASARAVGATHRVSLAAAAALSAAPAVLGFLTAAYVNTTALALILLGASFGVTTLRRPRRRWSALTCGAFGLAAGVQVAAAPFLIIAAAAVVVTTVRRQRPLSWRLSHLGLCVLAACAGAPGYLRAWWMTGSPLYPLPLSVAGRTLWPGNEELTLLLSGQLSGADDRTTSLTELVAQLFGAASSPGSDYLNLGPGGLLLVLAGLLGLASSLWRRADLRWPLVLATLGAAAVLAGFGSEGMTAQRGEWASLSGRFLLPALAVAVLAAATLPQRLALILLGVAGALHLPFMVPSGWSIPDLQALAALAPWFFGGVVLAVELGLWLRRRRRPWAGLGTAVVVLLMATMVPLDRIRPRFRYAIYDRSADLIGQFLPLGAAHDLHRVIPTLMAAHPIWKRFDDGVPQRIAVTAGWDQVGHNWFLYPLLGSALDNTLLYVPVTRSGAIVDYRKKRALDDQADVEAWVGRLLDRRVQFVVTLTPAPLEQTWIERHPALFTLDTSGKYGMSRAYRFHAARARRWLADGAVER